MVHTFLTHVLDHKFTYMYVYYTIYTACAGASVLLMQPEHSACARARVSYDWLATTHTNTQKTRGAFSHDARTRSLCAIRTRAINGAINTVLHK